MGEGRKLEGKKINMQKSYGMHGIIYIALLVRCIKIMKICF